MIGKNVIIIFRMIPHYEDDEPSICPFLFDISYCVFHLILWFKRYFLKYQEVLWLFSVCFLCFPVKISANFKMSERRTDPPETPRHIERTFLKVIIVVKRTVKGENQECDKNKWCKVHILCYKLSVQVRKWSEQDRIVPKKNHTKCLEN